MDRTLSALLPTLLAGLLLAGAAARPAAAQQPGTTQPAMPIADGTPSTAPVTMTLEAAIRVALDQNYALRGNRLDVQNADAQVRGAWGQLFPQVSASGSYTRNVVQANPFAGSDLGGLFGGGPSGDWVAFNERARQDGDPATEPITFDEFAQRQGAAQQQAASNAGLDPSGGGGNPFGVDNEFLGGISVQQTLYNGSAFAAVKGAQQLKDVNLRAVDRQQQLTVDQVRTAFYNALLAQEQAAVAAQSVDRQQATLQEVDLRVERGVAAKYQRLSTEVELANQRTQLTQAQTQATLAKDNLKLTLGFPMDQPITLAGALAPEGLGQFRTVSMQDAVAMALERRPDVQQARLAVELREVQQNITEAERYPTLSAVANFNYSGRVPDQRTTLTSDPDDPFAFGSNTQDFFGDDYWNPSLNVGLQLSWNIFSGFQRAARVEQDEVAVNRAQLQLEQTEQQVRLDVQRAMENLRAARQRIQSQSQNVDRAQTNYQFTDQRVQEGVSSQLELREANQQLDQSRLNYLQAVYDYLTAQSALETAVGVPLAEDSAFQFTRGD